MMEHWHNLSPNYMGWLHSENMLTSQIQCPNQYNIFRVTSALEKFGKLVRPKPTTLYRRFSAHDVSIVTTAHNQTKYRTTKVFLLVT